MEYSDKYQFYADRFARECKGRSKNWIGAKYIGHWKGFPNEGENTHDWLAFAPIESYDNDELTGVYRRILVDENRIVLYQDLLGSSLEHQEDGTWIVEQQIICPNPLYRDIQGKVITDFYSEYDLEMLGANIEDNMSILESSDYEKAVSLYLDAKAIKDADLAQAALDYIQYMQEVHGYGQE